MMSSGVRRGAQLHVVLAAGIVAAEAAAESLAGPEIAAQPAAVLGVEQRLRLAPGGVVHGDRGTEAAPATPAPADAAGDVAIGRRGRALHPGAGEMPVLDVDRDRPLSGAVVVRDAAIDLAAVVRHHGEL